MNANFDLFELAKIGLGLYSAKDPNNKLVANLNHLLTRPETKIIYEENIKPIMAEVKLKGGLSAINPLKNLTGMFGKNQTNPVNDQNQNQNIDHSNVQQINKKTGSSNGNQQNDKL